MFPGALRGSLFYNAAISTRRNTMVTTRVPVRRLFQAAMLLACVMMATPSPAEVTGPCRETIIKYCKDVVPGGGRIMRCLNEHRDDQSIACKDWLEDQSKSINELMSACPEEIAKLCNIDPPDKFRIFLCLNDNYVSLKMDCRSKLGEIKDRLR
jgi:hypothetical protein